MTNWTKEPWAFRELRGDDGLGYIDSDGHDIMHAGVSDLSAIENRANAYRIVACVNACTDIPNPAAVADVVEALRGLLATHDEDQGMDEWPDEDSVGSYSTGDDKTIYDLPLTFGHLRRARAALTKLDEK